eukprot:172956-Amphidinium_carterae.1
MEGLLQPKSVSVDARGNDGAKDTTSSNHRGCGIRVGCTPPRRCRDLGVRCHPGTHAHAL